MRVAGAFANDNDEELTLTPRGRYLLVVMMRQFFIGVNNLRDQARAALTGEERELAADDALLARYRQRLARHQELWGRAAGEYGVRLIRLTVEEFYPGWNLQQLFRCGVLK